MPVPDDKTARGLHRDGLSQLPVLRQAAHRRPAPEKTAIPTKVGDPSPIKHVIYIIKENRTYDQVFGDMPAAGQRRPDAVHVRREGHAEPPQAGRGVRAARQPLLQRPRHRPTATRGRTMAYNTDYIARNWAPDVLPAARASTTTTRATSPTAPSGYIWDACKRARAHLPQLRRIRQARQRGRRHVQMEGRVPGLVGHMCPDYGIPKVAGQDDARHRQRRGLPRRVPRVREERQLPRFIVMSLGEDHTDGTRPAPFTPQACVASNDLALGRTRRGASARASSGRRRRSSSSRTTPRTAPTTSTPTARSAW